MEYTTKILIADEDITVRSVLRDGLIRAGYRNVEEASNGEDTMLKMSRSHPDIVIMDVWLSKLDGIGVLRSAAGSILETKKPPLLSLFRRSPIKTFLFKQPRRARSCVS